ncbi:hypothetical protein V6Z11_A03G033400 [Gossypium hirsutum]
MFTNYNALGFLQVCILVGMTTIRTASSFRQHKDNGVKSIRCHSRLDLTPLRDRSCPSPTAINCTSLNISHLVAHDVEPCYPSSNSSYFINFDEQGLQMLVYIGF